MAISTALKINAMRVMDTVANIMTNVGFRAGMMFGGNRDLYNVYGYKQFPDFTDYYAKYQRQDVASRIVDMPANAIWTDPPVLSDGPVKDLFDRLITAPFNLWDIFNRADKLAGLGHYSTILVGFNDATQLDQPVRKGQNRDILYLQPYSEASLVVAEYEADNTSPRFGQPVLYSLQPSKNNPQGSGTAWTASRRNQALDVHWTRVVHICDNALENLVWGTPRLKKVYNLLDDLLKVAGGSSEIWWLNARGGIHIDVDKEMDLDPNDAEDLANEIDEYVNNLRRVVRTRGVSVKPISMSMPDPSQPFGVTCSLISAGTAIPQRILFGSEAGQLASTQDRANWAVHVEQRRDHFAVPRVITPFIACCQNAGMLPSDVPYPTYIWPEAFKLSPLERGQASAQQARTSANISKTLIQTPNLLSIDEGRAIIAVGNERAFDKTHPTDVVADTADETPGKPLPPGSVPVKTGGTGGSSDSGLNPSNG